MTTVEAVRAVALSLPRTTEHLVHDRVTFRVKAIVYAKLSRDESLIGLAFPKEERAALVASSPTFLLPPESDLRFSWVLAQMDGLDDAQMTERVGDAWSMVVPRFLVRQRLG